MSELAKYFVSVRKSLRYLLLLSVVAYFIIEMVLRNYPPLFLNASVVADFFSRLFVSYISAFIFYFIVVHIKSERDKENINEYAGHEVHSIITSGHLFIQPLMQVKVKKARFKYMEEQELWELFSSIDRFEKIAPLSYENGDKADWIAWFEHLKESIERSINEIMVNNHLLDSELIKLIMRIKECPLFKQFYLLYDENWGKDLTPINKQMLFFLTNLKRLEEYADLHLKEYKYLSGEFMGSS
ncbi:MAG: hypothetical protein KBT88_00150 [Gammaproteobacteria bacterium]|nr:hypothetical protein [Gammaproteobacteria bacterium]MBQ0838168.1 hypothetical protein [Gammaproteobacteria bacterium]